MYLKMDFVWFLSARRISYRDVIVEQQEWDILLNRYIDCYADVPEEIEDRYGIGTNVRRTRYEMVRQWTISNWWPLRTQMRECNCETEETLDYTEEWYGSLGWEEGTWEPFPAGQ
jgi:hypothetical protein